MGYTIYNISCNRINARGFPIFHWPKWERTYGKAKNEISCIYFSLTSRLNRRVLIMWWGWSLYRMIHTLSGDMECVNVLCAIWIYTRVLCCWFAPKVDPHSSWHKMSLSGPIRTIPWLLIFLIHALLTQRQSWHWLCRTNEWWIGKGLISLAHGKFE